MGRAVAPRMTGRKILFVTTDQQRYDALGVNGGAVARTPVVDGWAKAGINYRRAHVQNVTCTPSRSTMLTGQLVRTHGVTNNGIPLPEDAPSIAAQLQQHGYRTALIGKAHFEPVKDSGLRFAENAMATAGSTGPCRGFERMELAWHGADAHFHYDLWMQSEHPDLIDGFYAGSTKGPLEGGANDPGGDTGAPRVKRNPVSRDLYHTDWVADRVIAFLDSLDDSDDWFIWASFPDPHPPWDPPASEMKRVDWRDLDLPAGYPGSAEKAAAILADRPPHWLEKLLKPMAGFTCASLTANQIREINAVIHVENELIDEACGRIHRRIIERGWDADTDLFFTSDHGELQGDFGLLWKGPYHCDALMRVPLVWRPAPAAGIQPAEIAEPVGLLDLAPTWASIAGASRPAFADGDILPTAPGSARERVVTEADSRPDMPGAMRLRSIHRDGYTLSAYEGEEFGELYDCTEDPLQFRNLWSDPARRAVRDALVSDLFDNLPPARDPRLLPVSMM